MLLMDWDSWRGEGGWVVEVPACQMTRARQAIDTCVWRG